MTSQEFVGSVELMLTLMCLFKKKLLLGAGHEQAVINRAHDFSKISGVPVVLEWRRVQAKRPRSTCDAIGHPSTRQAGPKEGQRSS